MAVAQKWIENSIQEKRESLPIFNVKDDLVRAIIDNTVLIVVGETGSGKTTQITQYLAEYGLLGGNSRVVCAQPYGTTIPMVADYVAKEYGSNLGEQVGFVDIHETDWTNQETVISYTTYANLLNEGICDPDFQAYSAIVLDDAHERIIATDILFGLLKSVVQRRDGGLKLIITCAEWEAGKFSNFFLQSQIFQIPSIIGPVEIFYENDSHMNECLQIHLHEPAGDILFFPPDPTKVDWMKNMLHDCLLRLGVDPLTLIIFHVNSAVPSEIGTGALEAAPDGCRKLVIVTSDVAEASLTIDGIMYVIDSGLVNQLVFDPNTGRDEQMMCPISQAVAVQRACRAGQNGPGKCYRLFSEGVYHDMSRKPVPEIYRIDLAAIILLLKSIGIHDLISFDFIDQPLVKALTDAYSRLLCSASLDETYVIERLQVIRAKLEAASGANYIEKIPQFKEEVQCELIGNQ